MARVSFRLPNIQELSKQQRNALDLPLDGQHLIVGGPGTGKSVVALLRARKLAAANKDYLFLVYNVLLDRNSYGLGGDELKAVTWKKWFKRSFQSWFGQPMPTDNDGNENWDAISAMSPLADINLLSLPYLVIDEGQDMPQMFYEALKSVGFTNFYVVADQNQIIAEQNSSRQKIEQALSIDPVDTLELTENYRNTLPVARLAQVFYTNDPASPPIELPKLGAGEKKPRLTSYGKDSKWQFDDIVNAILIQWDRNVDKLLVVITADDETRIRFRNALADSNVRLSEGHERPRIQTYSSKEQIEDSQLVGTEAREKCPQCGASLVIRQHNSNRGIFYACCGYPSCKFTKPYTDIDFRNGGIAVINQQSIKGLEFDTVFVADIDQFWGRDQDELMKKFYVMVSRARENVVLLRDSDVEMSLAVKEIIPSDDGILEKR
jgi:predicted RNA-binding Zn-ribbon protein involved in translation (DUF1610 family)